MAQFNEIDRLIKTGLSDRQISKALKCRRSYVAGIRKQQITQELLIAAKDPELKTPPDWTLNIDWNGVEKDLRNGFQVKRIWEDMAQNLTSQSNFFKYIKTRFAHLLQHTVTLRSFNPGEHCEVDYAGDKIQWFNSSTATTSQAHIFVGILCFSQKIFAIAHENEQKRSWLDAHRRLFEFYGGVPRVVVPDCLKNGVIKAHLYDPDLNPDYIDCAKHYNVAIVPARVRHPRDKALVENAVGILMRYFKFIYRKRTFTSLSEINDALAETVFKLNEKRHSRFKISRNERFETLEKGLLNPLPLEPYSLDEWKTPSLHLDCTVCIDGNFYSAPHIYRGKQVRVRCTQNFVEIYHNGESIALHSRLRGKVGERVIKNEHLPENSRAYLESTPQTILSHAGLIHKELHQLIDQLFQENALANLRRAQGLVRKANSAIHQYGRLKAIPWIEEAVAQMNRSNRIRVHTFEEIMKVEIKKTAISKEDRNIMRKPGNPMVRGHGTRSSGGINSMSQTN